MTLPGASRSTPRARGRLRLLVLTLLTALIGSMLATIHVTSSVAATDPCGAGGNEISCENSKPGNPPSEWDVQGAGAESIQGFSTDISVNVGQKIDFKVDTNASAYTVNIYRLGYYGGDGARKIATVTPSAALPQTQPQCITEQSTELYDCGNWAVSASWDVPSSAVSGVYIALLHRADRNDSSHITFVVRDDASRSDLVFQTSDTTWQAYNTYGGADFYRGAVNGRAYKISYNRPVLTRDGIGGRDFFFSNEYPLVRFLEKNGYDTSYIAGVDTDRRGSLLTNHKTFLSVGHDEYWSGQQRANVESARDAGVNLMFLSGNEAYWRTRYEASSDSSRTAYRTLVCYKETWANAKIDPSDEWTGTWRDPRFAPKSKGGGLPENGLTGTAYMVNYSDLPVTVSAAEGKLRLWRGTSLASMASGSVQLAPHTVGYESNEDLDNGARPPGLIRLSTTKGEVPEYLQDFGTRVKPGTTTHNLTMYRAASGALVFSAGSVQWTWGLDAEHDSPFAPEPADRRMQQAQVNLLADMSAQPTTLDSELAHATKSSDLTGPTVTIASPAVGSAQPNGTKVTLTGTAADTGGGVVAGVEVSTDGGTSWHPASGTTSWSYSHIQHGVGSTPVQVRAIDDSANQGSITSRSFNVSCPCSLFGAEVPSTPATSDPGAVELGLRFRPSADGFASGVRFYKGTGNTGTHEGSLWSPAGERLATVTFTNESASGWQTATFETPVPVAAASTYVVSYTAPNGHYAADSHAFTSAGVDATPLHVEGGYGPPPAGVYGPSGEFPNRSFNNTYYGVDVLFTTVDESPLTATHQWPLAGSSSVPISTTVSARFNKPVVAGTQNLALEDANNNPVAGSTSYDSATRTITFTPSSPLNGFVKHTATVTARDSLDNPVTTGNAWSFVTAKPDNAPGVCPCSIFGDSTTPTLLEDVDKAPVTLGVRFTTEASGTITGVRFYKGVNNVGTHTGTLWSAGGAELATGTFTNESTTGWQDLTFDQPVPITKNTTYVASYRAPAGRYSATPNAFAHSDLSRPPLRVTSSSGAYTYGTGFPSSTSSTSYLVDVVFEKAPPSIAIVGQDPAPGALSVPRNSPVRVAFSDSISTGYTTTVENGDTALAGSTSLSADKTLLTWMPSATMPPDAVVTVTLSGVVSTEGAVLPAQTWTFETRATESAGAQTLFGDQVPAVSAADEGSPVELGTAFTPGRDGQVTAIRFFKGPGNNGTHTGSLWSSNGTRLATVTFVGETSNGWQTANLSAPVPVDAGTTYVVSYLAPQGHFSYSPGFLKDPWASGDLTAPGGANGRYLYGAEGGFPQYSWGSSNYFVDVVFERAPATISVVDRTPSPGATDVSTSVKPSITFSAPLAPGWAMSVRADGTAIPGNAVLSTNGEKITFAPAARLPSNSDLEVAVTGVTSTEGATLANQTWTFGTESGSTLVTSLFGNDDIPSIPSMDDTSSVELGTAFTPSVDGEVTAIKFYKGSGNTGTHTGSIWSSSGTRLATVTFTNETTSGWQRAALATPLALTAGETYVVSYLAPHGRYSGTPAYFSSPRVAEPLTAPAGSNGRYRYGAAGGFPDAWYNATNYFVDVDFRYTPAG